jgi:hypothetical protein
LTTAQIIAYKATIKRDLLANSISFGAFSSLPTTAPSSHLAVEEDETLEIKSNVNETIDFQPQPPSPITILSKSKSQSLAKKPLPTYHALTTRSSSVSSSSSSIAEEEEEEDVVGKSFDHLLPFATFSPESFTSLDQIFFGGKFRYGNANVMDEDQCDFLSLREAVLDKVDVGSLLFPKLSM